MIKVIKGDDLKTEDVDLVCSACGRDHREDDYKEGVDFVFETEDGVEWCICMGCKIKFDNNVEKF